MMPPRGNGNLMENQGKGQFIEYPAYSTVFGHAFDVMLVYAFLFLTNLFYS